MTNPFALGGAYPRDTRYQMATKEILSSATSLPTIGISDGDTIRYKALASASGADFDVWWTLIYDASVGYWYYTGGAPMTKFTAATDTTTSLTYVSPGTSQIITIPLAGDWLVAISADMSSNTAGDGAAFSYAFGATAASDAWAVLCNANGASASGVRGRPYLSHAGQIANDNVAVRIRAQVGGTAAFDNRLLNVLPLRVR